MIGNLKAIAYHLEKGEDNGNLSREALAAFLRSVAEKVKSMENIKEAADNLATMVLHNLPYADEQKIIEIIAAADDYRKIDK